MKIFFILCTSFVLCLARPDVSHIINDAYLPPEKNSSIKYASATGSGDPIKHAKVQSPLLHAQIESIRPSIHIASFSLRSIVPLKQSYSQAQTNQPNQAFPQHSYYNSNKRQASSIPTESSSNFIAPLTYQQNAEKQLYTTTGPNSLPMPVRSSRAYSPPTPLNQYFTSQNQQPIQFAFTPQALNPPNYEAPTTEQQPQAHAQQSYTSTLPAQPTYSLPAMTQQTYLDLQNEHQPLVQQTNFRPVPFQQIQTQTQPPTQLSHSIQTPTHQRYSAVIQSPKASIEENYFTPLSGRAKDQPPERQSLVQQTYLPPVSFQHTETHPPPRQTYSASAQTYMSSTGTAQQSFSKEEHQQQNYFSPQPVPVQNQPTAPGAFIQQTFSIPASERQHYTTATPIQQHYVPQQLTQQLVHPIYTSSNFNSTGAYLPPARIHQTYDFQMPAQQVYQQASVQQQASPIRNLQQTYSSFGFSQDPISTQKVYTPPASFQQTVAPHISSQQPHSPPTQTYTQPQQPYSTASTTYLPTAHNQAPRTAQPLQSPPQAVQNTIASTNYELQARQADVQQLTSPAIVDLKEQKFVTAENPFPRQDVYSTSAKELTASKKKQHVTSPESGFYGVDLMESNAAPAIQLRPPKTSFNTYNNYEQPNRISSNEVTSSASGTKLYTQNQPPQYGETQHYSSSQSSSETYNYKAPIAQSIQKDDETTQLHTSTELTSQQAPKLNSPAASSYNYQPSTPIEPFNSMDNSSVQQQSQNISNNGGSAERSVSTKQTAVEDAQKTDLSSNSISGTEYASDGGYIYRRN